MERDGGGSVVNKMNWYLISVNLHLNEGRHNEHINNYDIFRYS